MFVNVCNGMPNQANVAVARPTGDAQVGESKRFNLEAFEPVAKSLSVMIAMFYGVGLLVTNFYLARWGISDFGPLKPKYVITGAWSLTLCLIASLPVTVPLFELRRRAKRSPVLQIGEPSFNRTTRRKLLSEWRSVIGGLGLGFALLNICYLLLGVDTSQIPFLKINLSLMVVASLGSFWFWEEWENRQQSGEIPVAGVFLLAAMFILVLSIVSTRVYGLVPDYVGGGKPVTAELILNLEGSSFWTETESGFLNSQRRTRPVKIIYQGENEIYVFAPFNEGGKVQERLVIISKRLIEGFFLIGK
jgi:hypothetical protein